MIFLTQNLDSVSETTVKRTYYQSDHRNMEILSLTTLAFLAFLLVEDMQEEKDLSLSGREHATVNPIVY